MVNTSSEKSSTNCAINNAYNLEMILDLNSSSNSTNCDTFVNYTENNENKMSASNALSEEHDCNSYSNKENLDPSDIFKCLSNGNSCVNKEEVSKIFLSNGIYVHPVILNGNYKDITELIDVVPNQTSEDVNSNNLASNANSEFADQPYDMSLRAQISTDNCIISFDQKDAFSYNCQTSLLEQKNDNCLKTFIFNDNNKVKGTLHFLNPSDYHINSQPEYIDINSWSLQRSVIPSPLSDDGNSQQKMEVDNDLEYVESCQHSKELDIPNNLNTQEDEVRVEDDNDHVMKQKNNDENTENIAESDQLSNVSDSSSPQSSTRRRRKRRIYGEKRKNPVRKAQITKASLDLIEKLTIPPSVFNARIKRRKTKPNTVDPKNLRQSCRTSGAIYCPPGPLTKYDYKEWPVDGMHERPFYDAETGTIIKYHIPVVDAETKAKVNEDATTSSKEENINN